MKEQWTDIQGYEGLYQVSNLGRIKSLNYRKTGKEKILEPYEDKDGYFRVGLYNQNTKKTKIYSVHRLVALMFILNLENKPVVNHIDCNKQNNCVDNLEWCTVAENTQHATKNGLMKSVENGKKKSRPIIATNLTTGEEIYFESIKEAARQINGSVHSDANIGKVLKGKNNSMYGYTYKYV
jgi:hypothetical protein